MKTASSVLYSEAVKKAERRVPESIIDDSLRKAVKSIVTETVEGLVKVGELLANKYDYFELVGRGELKSPALSSYTFPDFLFKVKSKDKFVLVGVKILVKSARYIISRQPTMLP